MEDSSFLMLTLLMSPFHCFNLDGALLLGASSLTGRSWMGSIWVYTDPKLAPNEGFCKAGVQTDAGVTQALWVSEKGILVASDSGIVYISRGSGNY